MCDARGQMIAAQHRLFPRVPEDLALLVQGELIVHELLEGGLCVAELLVFRTALV